MQPVEDFMREFFRARQLVEQNYQAARAPFRRQFFAEDCRYDSRAETLPRMESENIVHIEVSASNAQAITEQTFQYSGGSKRLRHRYHLEARNGSWLIRRVQTACFVCDGLGDASCPYCKGKQWLGQGFARAGNPAAPEPPETE